MKKKLVNIQYLIDFINMGGILFVTMDEANKFCIAFSKKFNLSQPLRKKLKPRTHAYASNTCNMAIEYIDDNFVMVEPPVTDMTIFDAVHDGCLKPGEYYFIYMNDDDPGYVGRIIELKGDGFAVLSNAINIRQRAMYSQMRLDSKQYKVSLDLEKARYYRTEYMSMYNKLQPNDCINITNPDGTNIYMIVSTMMENRIFYRIAIFENSDESKTMLTGKYEIKKDDMIEYLPINHQKILIMLNTMRAYVQGNAIIQNIDWVKPGMFVNIARSYSGIFAHFVGKVNRVEKYRIWFDMMHKVEDCESQQVVFSKEEQCDNEGNYYLDVAQDRDVVIDITDTPAYHEYVAFLEQSNMIVTTVPMYIVKGQTVYRVIEERDTTILVWDMINSHEYVELPKLKYNEATNKEIEFWLIGASKEMGIFLDYEKKYDTFNDSLLVRVNDKYWMPIFNEGEWNVYKHEDVELNFINKPHENAYSFDIVSSDSFGCDGLGIKPDKKSNCILSMSKHTFVVHVDLDDTEIPDLEYITLATTNTLKYGDTIIVSGGDFATPIAAKYFGNNMCQYLTKNIDNSYSVCTITLSSQNKIILVKREGC